MRHRHLSLAAVAVTTAVLTSACGAVSPAHSAAEEFEEHFISTYPDTVLEAVTTATDTWPWLGGEMSGSLVLADDTPPEVLSTILDEVATWQPGENATYDGVGVLANGICLFGSDSQLARKQVLRDRLYAEQLALVGSWDCPTWLGGESQYVGSLEDLMEDTAMVRSLWDNGDGPLRVSARLHDPYGSVDQVWATVPESVPDVLTAIRQEHPVKTFDLTDGDLRVAVTATTRVAELQALADSVAGADLVVEVMQGSLDTEKAAQIEEIATVADQVRAVPGVLGVDVHHPGQLVISVTDSTVVRAVHEAAVTHPDLGSATVEITVEAHDPEHQWARHRYFWQAGGSEAPLEAFLDLVGHESVSVVQVSNRAEPGASVELSVPLAEGFPQLKEVLPDGLAAKVTGSDALAWVEFTAARSLDPADLQTRFTTPDLAQLARDWNAAGSG